MRYEVNTWNIDVPNDIEIYQPRGERTPELISHSEYGARFRREATSAEKQTLIRLHTSKEVGV